MCCGGCDGAKDISGNGTPANNGQQCEHSLPIAIQVEPLVRRHSGKACTGAQNEAVLADLNGPADA